MANVLLYNLAAMTVASTGTGTITLGSAATINGVLFLSFAGAGVSNGETVAYSILDPNGASEVGFGVYTSAGTTLTRNATTSTNSNNAINMSANAIVRISPRLQDIGTPGQRPATTTNDSASAGNAGEYRFSKTTTGTSTVTISNASPAVVTWASHGLNIGSGLNFTTTGALPTGLSVGTNYYVSSQNFAAGSFCVSTSVDNALAGTSVNTSSAGSGTHTATSTVLLTTGSQINVTGMSLTAGDWDVFYQSTKTTGTATNTTVAVASISLVSSTVDGGMGNFNVINCPSTGFVAPNGANLIVTVGPVRQSFSATTTVYAVDYSVFTVSTLTGAGIMIARRVR